MFIGIIIAASLPLSLFNLKKMENHRLDALLKQGEANADIISKTVLNIILTSGGNINRASLDAGETLEIYSGFKEEGMVYAGAVLISSNPDFNGLILASIGEHNVIGELEESERISPETVEELRSVETVRKIDIEGEGICYDFNSTAYYNDIPLTAVRVVYSESHIAGPIEEMRMGIFKSTLAAILVVSLIGFFLSRIISNPVNRLIRDIEHTESGSFEYEIKPVSKDEIGRLAKTFNDFSRMLKLQIYELIASNRELRRLDGLKDEFLANMTHELRSPLHGMIGIAESLIRGSGGSISEDAVRDLSLIVTSGRRLARLVDDILDFSKLKHRDLELRIETVDLYSLVQNVIHVAAPLARGKPVEIMNKLEPEKTLVRADPGRLDQIIMNLLVNAIKFTDEGRIIISSSYDEETGMEIVKVSDTGIGIPEDRIHKVFATFEQADGSTARSYGGTGLGLAITGKLVELHGGRIWVDSVEGKGSVFSFSVERASPETLYQMGQVQHDVSQEILLPEEPDEIFRYPVKSEENITPLREKILVVDDDPVNIQILINHLTLERYDVITARDGFEALNILDGEAPPEMVLLDIMLPKMSGYDVCRKIREAKSLNELPILMLTAKNRIEDIVAGFQSGANDYLIKPVNREELIARVNALVWLKQSVISRDELNYLKRDIFIAHEIQKNILETRIPEDRRFDIAAGYRPMYELGGDFYDVRMIDDDRIAVLVADVSGHGIPAAIICSMLKVIFNFYESELLNPAKLLTKINRTFYEYLGSQFITACYACIDLKEMKLTQANAGHWPLIIDRGKDEPPVLPEKNGIPIGWLNEVDYENHGYDLNPGDRIVLYTDFMIEARNTDEVMLGMEGFLKLIQDCRHMHSGEAVDYIFEIVEKWSAVSQDSPLDDDATIVIMDIKNG